MHHRTALIVALVTAGAAVGLVAADLAWNLHLRVEAARGAGWTTLADTRTQNDGHTYFGAADGCLVAGEEMRLTFDNDKPFSDTVEYRVRHYNATSQTETTLHEDTWPLDAFEIRRHTILVPEEAVSQRPGTEPAFKGGILHVEYDRDRNGAYQRSIPLCVQEAT